MNALNIEHLRTWEGREERRSDLLALSPAQALAATLNHDPALLVEGTTLPPLYHWLYFPSLALQSELARDGHARLGDFMPPVPLPRRMFAGARVDYHGDLRIGAPVERVARIQAVRYKEGRSGPLVFVTVRYELRDAEGLKLVEEQDIAYRPATSAAPDRPSSVASTATPADFGREIVPDETLLFRFSALTFNAHRIHYDLPYTRDEGYPALVIHGPLTAVLLADLVTQHTGRRGLQHFSFRALSAFYLGDTISLVGTRSGDRIELEARHGSGAAGVTAVAVFG
jgi:3-methylfumaryl-CoA hydratase